MNEVLTYKDLLEEVGMIAKSMRDHPPSDDTIISSSLEESKRPASSREEEKKSSELAYEYQDQLNMLKIMGFTDETPMISALELAKGDINQASIILLDQAKVHREQELKRAMMMTQDSEEVRRAAEETRAQREYLAK